MRESRRWGWAEYAGLGLVVLGGGLRFFRIGAKSFWVDEAFSAVLTRLGV